MFDPMAGVGTIRKVCERALCGEIEPEWAAECGAPVFVADASRMPVASNSIGCICTSPVYGNRMSDHHDAKEVCRKCNGTGRHRKLKRAACTRCGGKGFNTYVRHTYRHTLGRALHPRNTGRLQWGRRYRAMHVEIWSECYRVMVNGGVLILNVSDHIRGFKLQRVGAWHLRTLNEIGFKLVSGHKVKTQRNRQGQNYEARVEHEYVYSLVKV